MLIEGHLARNIAKNLIIPGLDDKVGADNGGNLFGNDVEDFEILSMGSHTKSTSMKPTSVKQLLTSDQAAEKVGTFQTAFNMLKVFVGIGLLTTPSAFAKIGIAGGCVGMIIIGMIAAYTM